MPRSTTMPDAITVKIEGIWIAKLKPESPELYTWGKAFSCIDFIDITRMIGVQYAVEAVSMACALNTGNGFRSAAALIAGSYRVMD